jgi:hypothetical protein
MAYTGHCAGDKMKTIKHEYLIPVDVDGTLVNPNNDKFVGRKVQVYDPVYKKFLIMKIHEPNRRLLIEEATRGAFIIVWSKGGYEWARQVVIALDLVPYVKIVMTKPRAYVDDVPVKKWLTERIFIEHDVQYKR